MATKTERYRHWAKRMDKDPSAWPVAPDVRVYMVDCKICGSRMRPEAAMAHIRRHQRRGEAA